MCNLEELKEKREHETIERLLKTNPATLELPDLIRLLQEGWLLGDDMLVKPHIENLLERFKPLLTRHYARLGGFEIEHRLFMNSILFKLYKSLINLRKLESFACFFSKLVKSATDDLIRKSMKERELRGGVNNRGRAVEVESLDSSVERTHREFEDDILDQLVIKDQFRYCLSKNGPLSTRECEVLKLRLERMTQKEIADQLGITIENVRNVLSRAHSKIKHFLKAGKK